MITKLAIKNALIKALGGGNDNKSSDIFVENLTFDDNGKPISQQKVTVDKLPNIVGN